MNRTKVDNAKKTCFTKAERVKKKILSKKLINEVSSLRVSMIEERVRILKQNNHSGLPELRHFGRTHFSNSRSQIH